MIHPIIDYNIQVPNKHYFFFKSWKQHVFSFQYHCKSAKYIHPIYQCNLVLWFFSTFLEKKTNLPKILSKRIFMIGKHIL